MENPESSPEARFSLKKAMDAYEKKILLDVLEYASWNQTRAARLLGIHRNTLLMKLDAFQIKVKELKHAVHDKVPVLTA